MDKITIGIRNKYFQVVGLTLLAGFLMVSIFQYVLIGGQLSNDFVQSGVVVAQESSGPQLPPCGPSGFAGLRYTCTINHFESQLVLVIFEDATQFLSVLQSKNNLTHYQRLLAMSQTKFMADANYGHWFTLLSKRDPLTV